MKRRGAWRALAPIAGALAAGLLAGGARADLTLSVAGAPERVIAAEEYRCARPQAIDVPDISPNAFRRPDGTVVLLAGNRQNFVFTGPSLEKLQRAGCAPLLPRAPNPDPSAYADNEWLTALWSETPSLVFGFIHHEYHGDLHGYAPCDKEERRNRTCWYAATTLAVSRDGGRTFERPPPPDNVLFSLPYPFAAGKGRAGVFYPKVVGNPRDGMVYVLSSFSDRDRGIAVGQCLARGPGDRVGGWETWRAGAFRPYAASPYACKDGGCPVPPADCEQVLPGVFMSLRYLPARDLFLAVGFRAGHVVYATSRDLVSWTRPRDLMPVTGFTAWKPGDPDPIWYFSLLDPTSRSPNFDTLEGEPYLYYVRFRQRDGRLLNRERDIVRVRLRIEGS